MPWHYAAKPNFEDAIAARDLSTVVEFFEAPRPWGPWRKIKSLHTGGLGWFAPIVGQRFQVEKSPGIVGVFLYAAGLRTTPSGGLDFSNYKFNFMPLSLSTSPLVHKDPMFVGGR